MIRTTPRILLLALPTLFAACSSLPTRTFRFDAIDTQEQPLPCLVVVDGDWSGAAASNQFVNVGNESLDLKLVFEQSEVEVTVAAVQLDPDSGKPTRVPKSRLDPGDYVAEPRRLRATDPTYQLFILPRR